MEKTVNDRTTASLIKTIAALRHPQTGCPWDLAQTHHSLLPYLWEETHETAMAIDLKNDLELKEELGDLLLQILLHSQLAQERGAFNFTEVCQQLEQKIIERHPHVFAGAAAAPVSEHEQSYHRKKLHKLAQYLTYPPLISSAKIGQLAKAYDFDWEHPKQVWEKVKEEVLEVNDLFQAANTNQLALLEELGDLYFSLNQLCRHLGVSSEQVVAKGNQKFARRFQLLLELASSEGKDFTTLTAQEKEQLWQQVKAKKANGEQCE